MASKLKRGVRKKSKAAARPEGMEAPRNPDELWRWVRDNLKVELKRRGPLDDEDGPFEYLSWAFFEGEERLRASFDEPRLMAPDAVVLACRGGGKTYLGAVATALDMLFKPGIEVKILAGSVEQGAKMYAHLREIFSIPAFARQVKGRATDRKITLRNKSSVTVLAQSETSIRGVRAQKIRCDEVEMFNLPVWEAVQLVTRSKQCGDVAVAGSIEVLSTRHKLNGVMQKLMDECAAGRRRLFQWAIGTVMGRCEEWRECESVKLTAERLNESQSGERVVVALTVEGEGLELTAESPNENGEGTVGGAGRCALWGECRGRAKEKEWVAGHISVEDSMNLKRRAGEVRWGVEMRNERPRREFLVLPEFDRSVHVVKGAPWEQQDGLAQQHLVPEANGREPREVGLFCGIDFGFRSPTVTLWGIADAHGVLWIVDERAESEIVVEAHAKAINQSRWGKAKWVGADPAGRQMNGHTGKSSVQLMAAAGLEMRTRPDWVHTSMMLLHDRLKPAVGRPRLYVHARCVKLIEALESYHYDEERTNNVEPVKDGPDHAVDALRYLVVNLDKPGKAKGGMYGGF